MNLTPTQKADELIEKFRPFAHSNFTYNDTGETKNAIQCALRAVNEILNERIDFREQATTYNNERIFYWKEVKQILTDRL